MSEPTPRENRRSEKAEAAAERMLQSFGIVGDTADVRAAVRAAYIAGWNESIDDLKQMIDEAERG